MSRRPDPKPPAVPVAKSALAVRLGVQGAGEAEALVNAWARGRSRHWLYPRWRGMLRRCYSPQSPDEARYYHGKGIEVCEFWHDQGAPADGLLFCDGFAAFCEWALSAGALPSLVIDRVDPFGPYCAHNCRWITAVENSRRVKRLDFSGPADGSRGRCLCGPQLSEDGLIRVALSADDNAGGKPACGLIYRERQGFAPPAARPVRRSRSYSNPVRNDHDETTRKAVR